MQATNLPDKTNQWLTTAVTSFIILLAILLFGWVISRMGLFNKAGNSEPIAAPYTRHVTSEAMRFSQEELQVRVGQEVTVILDNRDLYGHSFDVAELDLHVEMPPNGRTQFTFIPTQSGTYAIYCAVQGHREAGMVSTLVVE